MALTNDGQLYRYNYSSSVGTEKCRVKKPGDIKLFDEF